MNQSAPSIESEDSIDRELDARGATGPAPTSTRSSGEPSVLRRLLPKLGISIALASLFVFLIQRGGVPLIPSAQAFGRVRWWAVGGYVGVLIVTHIFRATRWRFLIAPVAKVPVLEGVLLNWIGFFAIFALPLRLGEMARPALTKLRRGVPISVGFGTVAVERVLDGLVTSLCVMYGLFAIPHHASSDPLVRSLPYYGVLAVTVFTAALVGLLLFLWQRSLAVKLVDWTFGLVSKKLAGVVAQKVANVADGVRCLAEPRLAFGFLGETLVYWGLNAAGMWVLAWACGLEIGFGHAVGIMGILAIGILLPAGPGMFGNFQLAVSVALKLYLVESTVTGQGSVYIFLLYAIQAVVIALAGILPLYAMKMSFSDLLRTGKELETVPPPPA